jgi:hypothetical protein
LRATCKGIAPAGEVRQRGLVQPPRSDVLSRSVEVAVIRRRGDRFAERIQGLVTPRRDRLMPRYPNVFVPVSDGRPIGEIIERADNAMKCAGINSAKRREFRAGMPGQYALAVDYIREFCETD